MGPGIPYHLIPGVTGYRAHATVPWKAAHERVVLTEFGTGEVEEKRKITLEHAVRNKKTDMERSQDDTRVLKREIKRI